MNERETQGRHDPAAWKRSQRRGRETGCWVYIAAAQLRRSGLNPADAPPWYRVWTGERGRFVVTCRSEL